MADATQQERELFKAALRARSGPSGDAPGYPGAEPFHWDQEQAAWWGWQAGRASLPSSGEDELSALMSATKAALAQAVKNPGQPVDLPSRWKHEMVRFMSGEPSLFDRVPFVDIKALGDLDTALSAKEPK